MIHKWIKVLKCQLYSQVGKGLDMLTLYTSG